MSITLLRYHTRFPEHVKAAAKKMGEHAIPALPEIDSGPACHRYYHERNHHYARGEGTREAFICLQRNYR